MDESGESLQDDSHVPEKRDTWVERQLGEGWTEVEPGIYRFTGVDRQAETGIRQTPPADPHAEDLTEALQPTNPDRESERRSR